MPVKSERTLRKRNLLPQSTSLSFKTRRQQQHSDNNDSKAARQYKIRQSNTENERQTETAVSLARKQNPRKNRNSLLCFAIKLLDVYFA